MFFRSRQKVSVLLEEKVSLHSSHFSLLADRSSRQSLHQRHKVVERSRHDPWPSRWYSQVRKDEARCQNWPNAFERGLVRISIWITRIGLTCCRIPFERALDFANKEKITDLLYPLFVHNIGGLLYAPENAPRTNAVVAASERRRMDSIDSSRPPQSAGPTPSLHHHHSMQGPVGGQAPPTPHSIAPHPNAGRPGIDRAHTFPTPPTSASSVLGMGNQGSSYEWGSQNMPNGVNGSQPLSHRYRVECSIHANHSCEHPSEQRSTGHANLPKPAWLR